MSEFTSVDDEEILRFIEGAKPKIYVVGTGGSGSNTVNRLATLGIEGATLIAMNTDAPHLIKTRAERKLLLGKKVTKGLGAGSDIKVGEEAAMESKDAQRAGRPFQAEEDVRHRNNNSQRQASFSGTGSAVKHGVQGF